jgi:caffeoyl-CoA O-methyltransferase
MLFFGNEIIFLSVLFSAGVISFCLISVIFADTSGLSEFDERVMAFLESMKGQWSDWNISYEDGKVLYDLVVKGKCKNIFEIGTSTGLSTIWLAWAAAKTGGKVTTIEVHKERFDIAMDNFKRAGVSEYIDMLLGNAHDLVPEIKVPVDFVFCDADKDWYLKYFQILEPEIRIDGCFTAHNVLWAGRSNINQFIEYLKKNQDFHSYLEKGSGEGISVSCRIK